MKYIITYQMSGVIVDQELEKGLILTWLLNCFKHLKTERVESPEDVEKLDNRYCIKLKRKE